MIIKFYDYINEARVSDISSITSDNELIKSYKEKEFEVEKKLIRFITLDKRNNNKKLRFNISYYDNFTHQITKRIEERTSLKSIEEFNNLLKIMINTIVETEYLNLYGKYGCYFEDYNFTIIFSAIDFIKKPEIKIVTIISGFTDNLLQKTFFI